MIWRFIGVILLAVTIPARAFVVEFNNAGFPLKWDLNYKFNPFVPLSTNVLNPATHAIRYYLAADGYSTTNTAAELNAIRASMAQWMAIPGTSIKFEEAGLLPPSTNALDINLGTNSLMATNYLFWKKGTSTLVDNGLVDLGNLLGLTFRSWFPASNSIYVAQTVFNGVDYSWFTDYNDSANPNYFVEGTATHELGHFLGLVHTAAGAATMVWQGTAGLNFQSGLTADEMAAARYLYPATNQVNAYGKIAGTVSFNTTNLFNVASQLGLLTNIFTNQSGIYFTNIFNVTNIFTTTNIFGAVVTVEDPHGNVVGCALTSTNGTFLVPALTPGIYNVRVTPLDSSSDPAPLINGRDIDAPFASAFTQFLPSTNVVVPVAAGATNKLSLLVAPGVQPFTLNYFRDPTDANLGGNYSVHPQGLQMTQGQTNFIIGVLAYSIPTTNIVLGVGGDGIDYTPTTVDTNSFAQDGLTMLTIQITIHSDAVPGLRTFYVSSGGFTYSANGYLKIRNAVPDFNFDGLDDRFQRQYFPLFTAPQAGPLADPDGDGYNNYAEYISGTNPTNRASFLKIDFATQNQNGTLLGWQGQPDKTYQVLSKVDANEPNWHPVGPPFVSSTDASSQAATAAQLSITNLPGFSTNAGAFEVVFFDSSNAKKTKFYRVQALPPSPP